MALRIVAPLAWAAALMPFAHAAIEYRGVNLSAAAFGHYSDTDASLNHLPGIPGTDYTYPDPAYYDYFHGAGMNTFRLPIRWERIQPTPGGALDAAELIRLTNAVDYATGLGANIIIDVHNYARFITGDGVRVLGSPELPNDTLADLWTRLGGAFANRSGVIFDLMNEPHGMTSENVVDFTNQALQAIRGVGANNLVLVEGNGYSGGHSWLQSWYGTPNSTAMLQITADPNIAFQVHQYVDNNPGFDSDYSGLTDNVESATIVPEKLADFTAWLRTNNLRGFLGELGTPASDLGVQAMYNGIEFVENNADVWMGWALWSGGPWWDAADGSSRYHLSVNPIVGANGDIVGMAPQLAVLEPFLNPVPEPAAWLLVLAALPVLAMAGRRRTA